MLVLLFTGVFLLLFTGGLLIYACVVVYRSVVVAYRWFADLSCLLLLFTGGLLI